MRQHFFSLKNSTSFRHYMIKFYRIFRIAWKFLAKFVEWCLKKLYYTAFFSKIFQQDFSLLFDIKQQHFLHRLAFAVENCLIMSKKIVLFCSFYKIMQSFSTYARVRMVSNNVKFLACRFIAKNEVDDVYKKTFKNRLTFI